MIWNIDPRFDLPVNRDVLNFLRAKQPSAHSDVAEELYRALEGVAGAAIWCPDAQRFAWVAAHTPDSRMFALAFGMRAFAVRLAQESIDASSNDGGVLAPEIGPDWVMFDPFLLDVTTADMRVRLKRWTAQAKEFVETL